MKLLSNPAVVRVTEASATLYFKGTYKDATESRVLLVKVIAAVHQTVVLWALTRGPPVLVSMSCPFLT